MTRPASGARRPSSSTRRRSTYQSARWPEERMKSPRMTAFALIAASSSARSLTVVLLTSRPLHAGGMRGKPSRSRLLHYAWRRQVRIGTSKGDRCAEERTVGAVDRCALFVDASYVLADGAMAVHGTRRGESVSWDYEGLVRLLSSLAAERSGLPLLRCYWYETSADGRRLAEHDALADLPGIKFRLAKVRPGRREGVETEIQRDLTTLARNNAIRDRK